MKKSIIYISVINFIFYINIFSANFGVNTAEFLKIKPDANLSGMGEAGISIADGTDSLIYNPAGLTLLDKTEVSLTHILWFNNINIEYFSFAYPFDNDTGFGGSILWLDLGNFDSTGGLAPKIDVQNGLFDLGFGKSFGNINLGINAKGIYEKFIDETYFGVVFDTGLIINPISKNLFLGIIGKNIGFISNNKDPLPIEIGCGAGWKLFYGAFDYMNLSFDFSKILVADNIFIGLGFEYYFLKSIAIRLGLRYNNAFDTENLFSNFQNLVILSGGMGINLGDFFILDFSYTPMGNLGQISRISLKFKFGESIYEKEMEKKKAIIEPKVIKIPKVKIEEGEIKAVTFKPSLPEEKVKEWKLEIKTSSGKIIKTFTGIGEVPKDLVWDGTDKVGKIVAADANYIFDFKVKDVKGEIIKTTGKIAPTIGRKFSFAEDKTFIPKKNKELLVVPIKMVLSSDINERKIVPFVMENEKAKRVKSWRFLIKNKNNSIIKEFKGKKNIPMYLIWDGKDSDGNDVKNPLKLKYVLEIVDNKTHKYIITKKKVVRNPFVIIGKGKKLKMARRIYFEHNSSKILPQMAQNIKLIAEEISKYKKVQVFIQGFAWDEKNAYTLSLERAKSVLRYLVEKYKINPSVITAMGYGDNVPVKKNNPDINRRVEIVIIGEK